MVLSCGSLSYVDDDRELSKSKVDKLTRGKRRNDHQSRSRKPRRKGGDKDPLSLLGKDFSVRGFPLAALERNNGQPPRHRSRPRQKDLIGDEDEERLLHLQKVIYENGDCPLSDGTMASIRKRGLDQIDRLLSASSSSSLSAPHTIHNQHKRGQKAERKILWKVHGKNRSPPLCPHCSGDLTYLYISTKKQTISACEIHNGDESTKEKLRNLLPPLCQKCEAHLLFEHSEFKFLMMENYNEWMDSDLAESDEEYEGFIRNFLDSRIAKLIVINSTPVGTSSDQDSPIHSATSFGEITPRLSNTSSEHDEEPTPFDYDDNDMQVLDNPIFSGLSSITEHKVYRRKGQLDYDHIKRFGCEEEQNNGKMDTMPSGEVASGSFTEKCSDKTLDSCFSNDDPFSELHEDDEDEYEHADCSDNSGDTGQQQNEQLEFVNIADVQASPSSSLPQAPSLCNKSAGSIGLIHTMSEELAILDSYVLKKEVATMQIAKDIIRGHELTESACERCQMPMMMKEDGTIDCTTCPAIQRKAKRLAKQKRKKMLTKWNKQRYSPLKEAEKKPDNIDATMGKRDNIDEKENSFKSDPSDIAGKGNDNIDENMFDDDRNDNPVSLALDILEDAKNLNALEEGRIGSNVSAENCPLHISESMGYSAKNAQRSNSMSWQQQPSSSSIGLNPFDVKETSENSISSNHLDYWVHHSSSQFSTIAHAQTPGPSNSLSTHSHHSMIQPRHSTVECSISTFKENSGQKARPNNLTAESGGQLCHSFSNRYQGSISEVSEYQGSSEVSSRCPRNVPSDDMTIQQYHPTVKAEAGRQVSRSLSNQYQGSISEVSEYQGSSEVSSRCPRNVPSDDMTKAGRQVSSSLSNQYQGSISEVSDYQRPSEASLTQCPRHFPPSEMMYHQYQPNVTTAAEEQLYHSESNPFEGSILEVSGYQESSQPKSCLRKLPSHDIEEGDQLYNGHSNQHRESSSDVSEYKEPSQCPQGLPPRMPRQHQSKGTTPVEEQLSHSQSNQLEGSISEVSGYQAQRTSCPRKLPSHDIKDGDQLYQSHSNQHQGSSSDLSKYEEPSGVSTQCPRDLPPSDIMHRQHQSNVTAAAAKQLYHSQSTQFEGSISEASGHQGSTQVSETQESTVIISAGADPQSYQSHSNQYHASALEVSDSQGSSEASLTRCPRTIPSSEMIWHHDSHNCISQPAHYYPVQSALSEPMDERVPASHVQTYEAHGNNGRSQESIMHPQHGLPQQTLPGMLSHKDEYDHSAADSWRDWPQYARCNDPGSSNGGFSDSVEEEGGAKLLPIDIDVCKEASEDVDIITREQIPESPRPCIQEYHSPLPAVKENRGDSKTYNGETCVGQRRNGSAPGLVVDARNNCSQTLTHSDAVRQHVDDLRAEESRQIQDKNDMQTNECHDVSLETSEIKFSVTFGPHTDGSSQRPNETNAPEIVQIPVEKLVQASESIVGEELKHDPLHDKMANDQCLTEHYRSKCEKGPAALPDSDETLVSQKEGSVAEKQLKEEESLSDRISRLADALREVADQLPPKDSIKRREGHITSPGQKNLCLAAIKCPQRDEDCPTEEMMGSHTPSQSNSSIPCLNNSVESSSHQINRHSQKDKSKENVETLDIFEKGKEINANIASEFHQINALFQAGSFTPLSLVVKEPGSDYNQNYSSRRGFKRADESLPLAATTGNIQRPVCLWKHKTPMDTLPIRNNIAIPVSPITIPRDDKQFDLRDDYEENRIPSSSKRTTKYFSYQNSPLHQSLSPQNCRADPPGRRIKPCNNFETRDPPDDYLAPRAMHDCVRTKSPFRREASRGDKKAVATSNDARDPPEKSADPLAHKTRSDRNSVTPKSKGRRPRIDDNISFVETSIFNKDSLDMNEAKSPRSGQRIQYTVNDPSISQQSDSEKSDLISHSKSLHEQSVLLSDPSWEDNQIHAPLQTATSFGESSLGQLFQQIDEIEDDFNIIVSSLPSSEEHTIASSLKMASTENESLKSSDKHSLVEITLNNAHSFESTATEDSMVTDVVQRMRRIKDYIETVDSVDEEDGSAHSHDSQEEMSELMQRLTKAAESLRALHKDWDD